MWLATQIPVVVVKFEIAGLPPVMHSSLLMERSTTCNSRRQQTAAGSITEAEYIALSAATKEALWYNKILEDLNLPQRPPIVLYCDNKEAIDLKVN